MEKMHTLKLSAELLAQANASHPLPPSLININEWLPPDIHQLRFSARIEAKKKGFVIFVSHGKIYIKKNQSHSSHITVSQNNSLRVCYFNANSLKTLIEMLKLFLSTRLIFHIIAVSETKLDPNLDASSIVHLDNYVLLRRNRNKNGGRVALYIHNSISATILCSSDGIWKVWQTRVSAC